MIKCPICEKGTLKPSKEKHVMLGVDLGKYPGQRCSFCKEIFTDSKEMIQIEKIARQKGIWGLGKKTKITRTGNSLAVRIPKEIADYLHLKEGTETWIQPEGDKLVIEKG